MDLKQSVLAKLKGEGPPSRQEPKAGGRFRDAAELAWKAMKNDNFDEFTSAFDAAVRIKLAERGQE
jgi:hypothetical protein